MSSAKRSSTRVLFVFLLSASLSIGVCCSKNASSPEAKAQAPAKGSSAKAGAVAAPAPPRPARAPAQSLPTLGSQHHPVFDLHDNRMLAHLIRRDGLAIAAGHPGFAKYVFFGRPWRTWRMNAKLRDGQRVALAVRNKTWTNVLASRAQAATKGLKLTLKVDSPKRQLLVASINKIRVGKTPLSAGWQRISMEIPDGTLKPGDNKLELTWQGKGRIDGIKTYGALRWAHVGEQPPAEAAEVRVTKAGGLWLPRDGGLGYYVHPFKGAKLALEFSAQKKSRRCSVVVRMQADAGELKSITLLERRLTQGTVETYVDLDPIANQTALLELLAVGQSCEGLVLKRAAIVMPGPKPKIVRAKTPKNILFWMIDNVRADRYKSYNPKTRVKTPVIDALARTGTVYTRAYVSGTESRVSHATIWTGVYPKQHQFLNNRKKLNLGWITIPEVARKAGLYGAAWIANGWVSRRWGFAEGFSTFRNTLHKGGGLTGDLLANHAIDFLQRAGEKPFFLYVGTIDVHVSWHARKPWVDTYFGGPYSGIFKRRAAGPVVEKVASGAIKLSARDKKRLLAIYDSTVSFNDQQLGRVLAALEKKGIRDETMIIVTSDHGEELWDYGRLGHGHTLRDTLITIPLIIHYPPLFGKGVRVDRNVNSIGLLATIADVLGQPVPANVQGGSLLPLAQGVGTDYPRPALATQYEYSHAIRMEDFKLWTGGNGKPHLLDVSQPGQEKTEINQGRPYTARWLADALGIFLIYQRSWRQPAWGTVANQLPAAATELEADARRGLVKP